MEEPEEPVLVGGALPDDPFPMIDQESDRTGVFVEVRDGQVGFS